MILDFLLESYGSEMSSGISRFHVGLMNLPAVQASPLLLAFRCLDRILVKFGQALVRLDNEVWKCLAHVLEELIIESACTMSASSSRLHVGTHLVSLSSLGGTAPMRFQKVFGRIDDEGVAS